MPFHAFYRILITFRKVGSRSLPAAESSELAQAISEMGKIYGSTKVIRFVRL